ncbi:MAG: PEP-CTERM sorting domain-containing protein [Candidatus Omnitrophica bacterium]|nr:PEP-CTERM sorting domain-containing protein [Candidatus Omnitrophota bacterium]MCA9415509.1 PEP-CTERM sorting domain-containing protein [Candidatus Omnitrophota bacterium]MCA9443715.1 PEP-CTERM sorting domain-containing protein [Candidatus Omnitrophota bacterium]MCB9769807.1 PEP-CTERM sorting domain-containing protein [Candidatus Omnitrophota bacterium]MCB9783855.1 PEP-CTERM sorting domain-containing protein [Candidatus Omnitrophota bacterium]
MKFLGLLLVAFVTLTTVAAQATRMSHVEDSVDDNGNGTWTYSYTVFNDSEPASLPSFEEGVIDGPNLEEIDPTPGVEFIIRDWELPYFEDSGIDISQILSPTGWSVSIETIGVANAATGWEGVANWQDPNDPFYFGDNSPFTHLTQVIHWYVTNMEDVINPTYGIYPLNSRSGFGFVASYDRTNAPYQASWFELPVQTGDPAFPLGGVPGSPMATQPVPEPASLTLLGLGAVGLVGRTARRTQK